MSLRNLNWFTSMLARLGVGQKIEQLVTKMSMSQARRPAQAQQSVDTCGNDCLVMLIWTGRGTAVACGPITKSMHGPLVCILQMENMQCKAAATWAKQTLHALLPVLPAATLMQHNADLSL